MRRFIFILLLGFNAPSFAASPAEPRFELMKCTSPKIGTLWASFGHLVRSGSDEVVFFPTEIVYFGKSISARLLFPTLEDALKINMTVGAGRIAMDIPVDGQMQRLRVARYDARIKNAYVGDWMILHSDKSEEHDLASCSAD